MTSERESDADSQGDSKWLPSVPVDAPSTNSRPQTDGLTGIEAKPTAHQNLDKLLIG